jgi:hypothetical protein
MPNTTNKPKKVRSGNNRFSVGLKIFVPHPKSRIFDSAAMTTKMSHLPQVALGYPNDNDKMDTSTMTLMRESLIDNPHFRDSVMKKPFANDILPEGPKASTATRTLLRVLENIDSSDFSAIFEDGKGIDNTYTQEDTEVLPTPIDWSRIRVVDNVSLKDSLLQAPESLDSLQEVLGGFLAAQVGICLPIFGQDAYAVQADISSFPATVSRSTSPFGSSWSSPQNNTKRSLEAGGGYIASVDSQFESAPLQNKRPRITVPESNEDGYESSTGSTASVAYDAWTTVSSYKPHQSGQWHKNFEALCEFRTKHGHCNVPPRYQNNSSLWRWIKRQRYQYKLKHERFKDHSIADDRVAALEGIGFVWDSQGTLWMDRLNELAEFRRVRGHCNVPSKYPANHQLSTWVKCQRRQYKLYRNGNNSNMTIDRIQALDNLGFVFEPVKSHVK